MKTKLILLFSLIALTSQLFAISSKILKEDLFFQKAEFNPFLIAEVKSINGNINFYKNGLTYQLGKDEKDLVHFNILNANPNPKISFLNEDLKLKGKYRRYYENKIYPITTYKKIIYSDIYPNIDLIFEINTSNQFEYSFLLHKGAKISDIKIDYLGEDISTSVNNEKKVSTIEIGRNGKTILSEQGLNAYQDGKQIPFCSYFFGKNISFKLFGLSDEVFSDLLIDPTVSWSGMFGGLYNDVVTTSCMDKIGNSYVSGNTNSKDYPVTSGAFQTYLYSSSSYDAVVTKYDSMGSIIWSTFLGGTYYEGSSKISISDDAQTLVCAGSTTSKDFPYTSGAYQTNLAGTQNCYITIFDSSGGVNYSTFYGGSGTDLFIAAYTKDNKYYFVGATNSKDFPITKNAIQKSLNGGSDAALVILDSSYNLEYGTYYGGGKGDDQFKSLQVLNGSIYIAGTTTSSDYKVSSSAQQSKYGGTMDGVITKFYPDNSLAWSTFAGGSDQEQLRILAFKDTTNIYVAGYSYSKDFPVSKNAVQSKFAGVRDASISTYNANGQLSYATYWGGSSDDGIHGGTVDEYGNFWGGSLGASTDFPLTSNALSTKNAGDKDWQLIAFNAFGDTLFSSYYGGSNEDICYEAISDKNGHIYFNGYTSSKNFPTAGSLSSTKLSGLKDAAQLKINTLDIIGNRPLLTFSKNGLCFPGDVISASVKGIFDSVKWSTGDTGRTIKLNVAGKYSYTVFGKKVFLDSFTITASSLVKPKVSGKFSVCEGESVGFQDTSKNGFSKATKFTFYFDKDSVSGNPAKYTFKNSGKVAFRVKVKEGNCSVEDTFSIVVNALPKVSLSASKTTICNGEISKISSNITGSTSGNTLKWSNGASTTFIDITKGGTYSLLVTSPVGCKDSAKITINAVNLSNKVDLGKKVYCEGETANLNDSINTGTGLRSYTIGTNTFNKNKISYKHSVTGKFTVYYKVEHSSGCKADSSFAVLVNPRPGVATISTSNSKNSFCARDGITLAIPSTTNSILWNNGSTTNSIFTKKGGYYNAIQTNSDGCTDSSSGIMITSNVDSFDVDFTASPKTLVTLPLKTTFSNYTLNKSLYTYEWSFGDTSNSTDIDPIHTYKFNGSYDISLVATNKLSGCKDTMTKRSFINANFVGVNEISYNKNEIKVYPNPAGEKIFIAGKYLSTYYQIINLEGKILQSGILMYNSSLNIQGLSSGNYILKIQNFKGIHFVKE